MAFKPMIGSWEPREASDAERAAMGERPPSSNADEAVRHGLAAKVRVISAAEVKKLISQAEARVSDLEDEICLGIDAHIDDCVLSLIEASARPGENMVDVQSLYKASFAVKGIAGTFGFELISRIGNVLCVYLRGLETADIDELTIIRHHVDALVAVRRDKLKGNGGATGEELLACLQQATAGA